MREEGEERGDLVLELYTIPPHPHSHPPTPASKDSHHYEAACGYHGMASHTFAASVKTYWDLRMDVMAANSLSCAVPNIVLFPRASWLKLLLSPQDLCMWNLVSSVYSSSWVSTWDTCSLCYFIMSGRSMVSSSPWSLHVMLRAQAWEHIDWPLNELLGKLPVLLYLYLRIFCLWNEIIIGSLADLKSMFHIACW